MVGKSLSALASRPTAPGLGGTAALNIGLSTDLVGGANLDKAFKLLEGRAVQAAVSRTYRRELGEMRDTAQSFVAVDKGHTREQIQFSLKKDAKGGFMGRVGVGLRGRSTGPKSRRNLAAIIEFGRRSFTAIIKSPTSGLYKVEIPAVPGQLFLTRTAQRHLPRFEKSLRIKFVEEIMRKLRSAERKARTKSRRRAA